MKRWTPLLVFPLLMAGLAVLSGSPREPVSREQQWKHVEEAVGKGLPRTAMEHLEPLIEEALRDEAYAEAIRAIGQKIALEGNIQGNKPEEKIVLLEQEMAELPAEVQPVLRSILANWYWHFFQRNRRRFLQRTETAEPPGEDITTWDLPRIFAEIDRHFTAALEAETLLRSTPIEEYDALLEKGTIPDRYRPTLYDFVVANALEFYSSGEQAAAKPQDAFVLSADSPIFARGEEFLAWEVDTTDTDSPLYKAIGLYQAVLAFHREAENEDAWIDWDLDRLRFGYNHALGEEKQARYKAALRRYVERWGEHENSARARYAWAGVLRDEGELVEAHRMAGQGYRQFPDSPGGRQCYNLMREIEEPSASATTERVWNAPWPTIQVEYRNVTEVHFRMVSRDWPEALGRSPVRHPEQLDHDGRQALLEETPVRTWSADLPATEDYQTRVEPLPAPDDLKPGFYFLLASHDAEFSDSDNVVSFAPVWVSDLALIMRSGRDDATLEGFVLDAASGEPLRGVEVRAWAQQRWNQIHEELETTRTDRDGLFRVAGRSQHQHVLLVRRGNHTLGTAQQYRVREHGRRETSFERTVFFTDRAIYRPGQTVRYKGICLEANQREDDYRVLPNRTVQVVFQDPNGKEIERREVRTNDYGSFSGSFTAPRDRVLGRMAIRVDGTPGGQTAVTVEEYKRPTFQVELNAPRTAPRLNDTVSLEGSARAYTGAATDGAQVRWRVVRQVQFPPWLRWRGWWPVPRGQDQEIAHGTTTTAADGTFSVEFTARPDPAAREQDEPTFHYTVSADVTDAAGETRSAERVVRVGYTALQASLSAASWLVQDEPIAISLRTSTLDGEGQSATGLLKVHRLEPPEQVQRAPLGGRPHPPYWPPLPGPRGRSDPPGGSAEPEPDWSNPQNWPLGEVVLERELETDPAGRAATDVELPAGPYRAIFETHDRFGKPVRAELPLRVLDPEASQLVLPVPDLFDAPAWSVEPGEEFTALWGAGYEQARAYIEIEHRGQLLQSYWTDPERTQVNITQEVTEAMRGGFTVRVTRVQENRAYLHQRSVNVPWSNQRLEIAWERFVSKLEPGQQETWTAVIRGPDAEAAVAEMVAALYDKSLDAFLPHHWTSGFGVFRRDTSHLRSNFENARIGLQHLHGRWQVDRRSVQIRYRTYPHEVIGNLWGYQFFRRGQARGGLGFGGRPEAAMADGMMAAPMRARQLAEAEAPADARAPAVDALDTDVLQEKAAEPAAPDTPPDVDLSQVPIRAILDETAFFFPDLISDEEGQVRLQFTMPEALTEWRFLGFAHDRQLRAGLLTDTAVTAKDLMVQPNPPRFLREGDELEFTVRVTNQSPARQTGTVRLNFSDARTGDPMNSALGIEEERQAFDVPAKESRTYAWRMSVPDGMGFLVYQAVGSTGRLSDGEEGYLPVLSRRVFVTESLPLPIRGPDQREFEFSKLLESADSETLQHQSLSVQMVSNPAWYAVMALPYLMEYPHRSSDQIFNRLYANSLARYIANSDPRIRRVFDQWKGTPALDSPLEKNEDLKAVALEETPWVRQAESESQARRNVGILFDQNRLNEETARAANQLAEMQRDDGAWPWFPGGPPNDHITLYITTGLGRLRHLGAEADVAPALKALTYLDAWIDDIYREIVKRGRKEFNNLSPRIALYLYGRSFFLQDTPIGAEHREAVDYFLEQARTYWLRLAHRQSQAHLALALHRFGDRTTAREIMRSIKERSVTDEELGRFWRELEFSWWWYRAPIETQAMMIEAFDEVMNDAQVVEECRVWLLKQKQTQDWKTTRATADAVYALLLRGADLLASDALVQVSLADQVIEPGEVEAGTGFYERRFTGPEVQPEMGRVTVRKTDEGVAWGSLHWQYLEDIAQITPHQDTPLTLEKALFIKEHTARGPVLQAVDGPVAVGDELVVRLVLRTDRDMEYVHLKDHRGSGTEPVNVLSRYQFQDGLYYYESTRDAATHFFIDYLPKGTYVFEYSVRVQHRGRYQTGMASIQCLYAPEFNSHSESLELQVQKN